MTLDELDAHLQAGREVEVVGVPANEYRLRVRVVERFGWYTVVGPQVRYRVVGWDLFRWESQPVAFPSDVRVWLARCRVSVPGHPYAPGWTAHPGDPDAVGGALPAK